MYYNLHNPLDSSKHTKVAYSLMYVSYISYTIAIAGAGTRLGVEDNSHIKFLFSSGNIDSGTISLYGIRNA